ncbi:hypothetical protein EBR03_04260 [bacterium]|nr:hypothetical protein [bacterium]
METLESSETFLWTVLQERLKQIIPFPEVISHRMPDIVRILRGLERHEDNAQAFCLELLAMNPEPEHIPFFESGLLNTDRAGEVRFPAALGLGQLFKKSPELITKERKDFLFEILNAKDDNDLARLYLRQNLPEALFKELDERVYQWQHLRRSKNTAARLAQRTAKEAREIAVHDRGQPARRALAFQALLELEPPSQKTVNQINDFLKQVIASANENHAPLQIENNLLSDHQKAHLEAFIQRTAESPKGLGLTIHDGIQIENLLTALRKKGIEVDPKTFKMIRDLTEQQFRVIWNQGNPLVQHDGDSGLSSYAHAAMVLSRGNHAPSKTLMLALKSMDSLRAQIHPETGSPKLYNYTSESYRKDATPASQAGRAVTSQLALYEQASPAKKPEEAQQLLKTTQAFEVHFSQLFELANHFRTHDRHPKGEGMAPYYGFGNVPYAAEALIRLKTESTLDPTQKKEVQYLAERIQNRLLNLMRFEDSFTENRDYNHLAMIALKKLETAFGRK